MKYAARSRPVSSSINVSTLNGTSSIKELSRLKNRAENNFNYNKNYMKLKFGFITLFFKLTFYKFFSRKNFHDGWEREGASIAVYHRGQLVVDLQVCNIL